MQKIELSGKWLVKGDEKDFSMEINLPGTTEMAGITFSEGKNNLKSYDHLRRKYLVNQKVFYKREFEITEYFSGKELELNLERSKYTKVYIDGELAGFSHDTVVMQHHTIKPLSKGRHEIIIAVNNDLSKYDDFDECLYNGHQYTDHTQTNWNGIMGQMYICVKGEREEPQINLKDNITVKGRHIYDNGEKIHLRGSLDCAIYPATGVCPFTKEEWMGIFKTYKEYGLNHCRFHSWCPPDAAFCAADEMGIYIQAEMSVFAARLYCEGHKDHNRPLYNYLLENGTKILKEYGNHKSFIIFAIGNELSGDMKAYEELVKKLKEVRNDILICAGSNNFLETPVHAENDDVWITMRTAVGANIRASYSNGDLPLGRLQNKERMSTNWNYNKAAELSDIPLISHEIGQYQINPDINEINGYTGPLHPDALEKYRERLKNRGRLQMWYDYFVNSGKLTALLYKHEVEAALRTDKMSGFQLLGLSDFTGQGTALVGILNSFYENKGIISNKEWKEFCNDTVILLEFPSFVYTAGEIMHICGKLYNYSEEDYTGKNCRISVNINGKAVFENEFTIENGGRGLNEICSLDFDTIKIHEASKAVVITECGDIRNHYNVYIYPDVPAKNPKDVKIFYKFTEEEEKFIKDGGKAVFINNNGYEGMYATDFWCYPMFKDACESLGKIPAAGTQGLLINKEHGALLDFPTDTYSDFQWQQIVVNSGIINIDDCECTRIAEVIDNFSRCERLSILHEIKMGEGTLIVSGCDFMKHIGIPEVRQLYNSVISYLSSLCTC